MRRLWWRQGLRACVWTVGILCGVGLLSLGSGCAECQFDLDCPNPNSLCQKGRCTDPADGSSSNTNTNTVAFCQPGQTRACYTGAPATMGVGPCRQGQEICDPSGRWGPCMNEVLPAIERCNQRDDDCDGQVDNGCSCKDGDTRPCYTGPPNTQDIGRCKAGTQTCQDKAWSACNAQQLPDNEQCNGQDDDCDGEVDEDIPANQECQVPGAQGACAKGTSRCEQGQPRCDPVTQPKVEECSNGVDDDCDGQVDEAPCACQPGETQACYSGPATTRDKGACQAGVQTCSATGGWGPCVGEQLPSAEACNSKDDDCDGTVDNLTRPCKQGCNSGKERCQHGIWQPCDAPPPAQEVCDGQDNDCNGKVDDIPGSVCQCNTGQSRACGQSVGSCKQGTQQCVNGQWSLTCAGEVRPSNEVCDGQDNDCNGVTDDGLTCTFTRLYWSGPGTRSYFCLGTQLFPLTNEFARLCRFPNTTPVTWQKTCIAAHPTSFLPLDHSTCRTKIYRYDFDKNGVVHHHYTDDDAWKGHSGDSYKRWGVAFSTVTRKVPGTVECKTYTNWTNRDTVVLCGPSSESTTFLNLGYKDVKSLGYASSQTNTSAITLHGLKLKPIWRAHHKNKSAHIFTTSKSEHDKAVNSLGYTSDNVIGQGIP